MISKEKRHSKTFYAHTPPQSHHKCSTDSPTKREDSPPKNTSPSTAFSVTKQWTPHTSANSTKSKVSLPTTTFPSVISLVLSKHSSTRLALHNFVSNRPLIHIPSHRWRSLGIILI